MTDPHALTARPALRGQWMFDEGSGHTAADSSGNGFDLQVLGEETWTEGGTFGGAVSIDGAACSWQSANPVLKTDEDFSVAAWVRLDSDALTHGVELPPGEFALTAVSQSGASHTPFYLGARLIPTPQADGTSAMTLRWNFTAAPIDGSQTGAVEWQHAVSSMSVDEAVLDRWVLLVGVYDLNSRETRVYVPSSGDEGRALLPENWTYWSATGAFTIGFGRYLDAEADRWPGAVSAVRAYSGVLTAQDVADLYAGRAVARH